MTRRSKTKQIDMRTGETRRVAPVVKNIKRPTALKDRLNSAFMSRTALKLTREEVLEVKRAMRKQSSAGMSSLASTILNFEIEKQITTKTTKADVIQLFRQFVTNAKALAGSVLSQDETKGQG